MINSFPEKGTILHIVEINIRSSVFYILFSYLIGGNDKWP